MTGQSHPAGATIGLAVGTALRQADAADDVVSRVLSGLRAAGDHRFTPISRAPSRDWPLPRRVPGVLPRSYSPWGDQPLVPAVREATAIARNTSSYLRGWRRGNEAVRAAGPTPVAALAAVAATGPPPVAAGVLRRIAVRPSVAAIRFVGVLVQLLPARERPRYHEEFRAELSRLTGLHQLGYVARLLWSAFALRRALRQPADRTEAK